MSLHTCNVAYEEDIQEERVKIDDFIESIIEPHLSLAQRLASAKAFPPLLEAEEVAIAVTGCLSVSF